MSTRRGLHGAVVDDLGLGIVRGTYPEGATLVPEEIGERHGVSRTVVRETLRVLEAKGLVRARPNVGTRVLPASSWHALDADVIAWRLRGPERDATSVSLRELRTILEPAAARLAAARATDAEIAALRGAFDAMTQSEAAGDIHALVQADIDFHDTLLSTAGNPLLGELSSVVAAALDAREDRVESQGFDARALALHGELLDAIAARDPERAAACVQELIDDAAST